MAEEETKDPGNAAAASATASATAKVRPRLWTGMFLLIIGLALCCFIMGQGLNSGTSVYLDRIGQTATLAGLLAAVFSGAAGFVRIIVGPVIDNYGRYKVIVVGVIILLIGTFTCMWADTIPFLVICRTLQGVGFSAATTSIATAAADVLPEERLGEGIGYYGLGQAIAMSIGPAFAIFLVGTDPASNLFLGLSAVGIIALVGALCCRYEKRPEMLPKTSGYRKRYEAEQRALIEAEQNGTAENGVLKKKLTISDALKLENVFERCALAGAIPNLIINPAFGFGIFFTGLYGTTLGVGNPGLFYTVSAVMMIIVRLVSGRFMDSVAPFKLAIVPTVAGLIAFGLLFFAANSDLIFYAAGAFYGICIGIATPLCQAVAIKNTPAERWGAANALVYLCTDVGIGIATIIWGISNDMFGFQVTTLGVMVCLVAFLISAWFLFPKKV